MPELNVIHITIIAALTVIGVAIGWVARGKRAAAEKSVVNAGWREQISAQRTEHDRLTEQNKALMEQVSQYLASNKDTKDRAKELAEEADGANQQRDQFQSEIKDIRRSLEVALKERDQLKTDVRSKAAEIQNAVAAKDARIAKLQASLDSWQGRLPPLIEKFQLKTEEANRLEQDLVEARARIVLMEASQELDQTLIESVRDPEELTDGRDASNDAVDDGKTEIMPNEIGEFEFEELAAPDDVLDPDDDQYPIDELGDEDDYEVAADYGDEDEGPEPDDAQDQDLGDDELGDESAPVFDDTRDNLKAIKGVGPAIEKTLYELGIRRFHQIADMSEYDIDRIAKHLKGFRSRIYREDWIGQARDLGDQDPSD